MSTYSLDPDLYDAVHADIVADIEPHVALLRAAGGPALELACGDGRVKVWDHADDDRVDQIRFMTRRIEFRDASGAVKREETVKFSLRYVDKPEMELLLHVAGFSSWDVRPAFSSDLDPTTIVTGDRPIREGDNLEWTAWRD